MRPPLQFIVIVYDLFVLQELGMRSTYFGWSMYPRLFVRFQNFPLNRPYWSMVISDLFDFMRYFRFLRCDFANFAIEIHCDHVFIECRNYRNYYKRSGPWELFRNRSAPFSINALQFFSPAKYVRHIKTHRRI